MGDITCLSCGRNFHDECLNPTEKSCCCRSDAAKIKQIEKAQESQPTRGRPRKIDTEITVSAGRKRAAVEYPINNKLPCEWRGLKNCGGGLNPIVGCLTGVQQERQHGPDKDTSNNDPGNVHKICIKCHHRWHELNDPVYDRELYKTLPHEPAVATVAELALNDANWERGGYAKELLGETGA